jgi:hypothetical protein
MLTALLGRASTKTMTKVLLSLRLKRRNQQLILLDQSGRLARALRIY